MAAQHLQRSLVPRSAPARCAAALALLLVAALLLLPPDLTERPRSWDDLIAPLGVGLPVTGGYYLAPPRRGEEHDVVYVARRDPGPAGPAARVEVHIVDRGQWRGVAETRSFGIEWEKPPAGSRVSASDAEANAVRDALVAAIARNDSGFASVNSIPLASEPDAPWIARTLDRLSGVRGVLVGACLSLALVLLIALPHGAIVVGGVLFVLGLLLRGVALDVPFVHDQDVQRLFTGSLPLREIATGAGLKDRHPPLFFFLLHFVELFGQSEAVVRVPAVIAGALAGPAILLAVAAMGGSVGPAAALAALAVTVSPELVARSREVSEIPLYALIVIAAAASLVASIRQARTARLVTLAASHALALFTYYLAPFLITAHATVLVSLTFLRKADWRVSAAFAAGTIAGAPAIVLGIMTFFRDRGARESARAFPALAWGEHSLGQMAMQMAAIASNAFGPALLLLLLLAMLEGLRRRSLAVLTPALGVLATFAGIALLSPLARVQAYYVTTVLPLAVLVLALQAESQRPQRRLPWVIALALAVACFTVPSLSRARSFYLPDADAFMPRFAAVIAQRPEPKVVTVAHYDTILLTYYLARGEGRRFSSENVPAPGTKHIEPLVMVHALDADAESAALQRLEQIINESPALVIERDAVLLPRLVERLTRCERLLQAPTARLLRCAT